MNSLINEIYNISQVKEIIENYKNLSPIFLHGLTDESKSHIYETIFHYTKKCLVIVCENEKKAKLMCDDINSFVEDTCMYFPSTEINYYNIKNLEKNNEIKRLEVLIRLINGEKFIITTSLDGLRNKLTQKKIFENKSFKIDIDSEIDLRKIKESFIELNYDFSKLVESKGEFSIRGSIIDFWPIEYDNPIRIELFDTEIDSIRFFDKDTQRSLENIDEIIVRPTKELIYDKNDYDNVIKEIKNDLSTISDDGKLVKIKDKYRQIISYLKDSLYIANDDLITPYRKNNFDSFFNYIDKDSLFIFQDLNRSIDNFKDYKEKLDLDLTSQMENEEVFSSFKNIKLDIKEIFTNIKSYPIINSSSLLKNNNLIKARKIIELKSIEQENFNKNIENFVLNIKSIIKNNEKALIFASDEKSLANIKNIFDENNINSYALGLDSDLNKNNIILAENSISRGYIFTDFKINVYSHRDIFGKEKYRNRKKTKKSVSAKDIINYSDIEIGDYVVHENNGIGIYKGISQIEVNNTKKDYFVIEYKGNDKVFVPVDQMDLVSKYIGNKGDKPKISSLGSNQWKKAKQRAKKAVDEIADDLVELYAKRSKAKGHAFSKDTTWQKEFEDSFVYEETDSQNRSIDEIKNDMEDIKPMDRLLCGDVGYGKTEVALRAAFKAIMDGYQVCFLVPTTILASQHYSTMKERFKDFPVDCALLSRFVSKKDQEKNIKNLKNGKVDIIVGTHRLLSKDIKFKNLGLLIIDEEQRFGVRHKDKLKKLKENIDVLTLSATPIPRTLQMSLTGIRDMSTLDEPPERRLPVNTYVLEYDESIIKRAIEKELDRDGQVYFVYNRVYNIEKIYNHLKDLIPDANIEIAHGQMSAKSLEKIMEDFVSGKTDILLATTIIETGMDIQNVNTIIVYDSDMMGLSQLYQLKGRIGRSSRSSYAYFTYAKGKVLTEIGEKRLKSIKDFSDFGSGYKIAMRDLELRGAGNILGESQSGQVEAIGYDLYVKFLQQAVNKASGKEIYKNDYNDVYIDLKVDAYIPDSYIEDSSQKIEIYTRISRIENLDDYSLLVEDLIDRYGDIPLMVDNLMYVSLVKSLADQLGFDEIREVKNEIKISYDDRNKFTFEQLSQINEDYHNDLSFDLSQNPSFKLPNKNTKLLDCYELLKVIENVKEKK
ncbi:MAG: transcription-repair coupling factor [Anaerococcus vaginalis]|uniref:transcription-repair coupling factor n=1 Tax=Anaerococcus jeddahensis TaxID=1673719 RepID=UPI0006726B29|nr:transcription-repair coupling factor [Anaerococcus jeddahensis]KWZ99926.1 transcription-repair coupling factor [Anaerococcus hydrogenalis]MDU5914168.1 transcription-repair coupling factor [Anaerococcus vaginalis]